MFQHRKAIQRLANISWSYWLRKQTVVGYMPYRLWIEPTNRCNLACTMCPNQSFSKKDLGMMDFQLFQSIIDQAQNSVHDVNLHHRGESTLHPKLVDMIRYSNDRGMKVKLHTNGTTLNENLARELIQSGLRLISFSFDGFCARIYEKIRIGAKFDRTIANIHKFLELKTGLGSPYPRTVLEMIDFHNDDTNESDRKSFIQSFTSRGLDRLIIKRPHNWAGNIKLDTGKNHSFSPCTFPWHALVVLWDGRVGACPHDFFARIIFGNVKEESLMALFNSSEIQKLRKQMLQRDVNVLESSCRLCDSIMRKKIMGIPLASFKYLRD